MLGSRRRRVRLRGLRGVTGTSSPGSGRQQAQKGRDSIPSSHPLPRRQPWSPCGNLSSLPSHSLTAAGLLVFAPKPIDSSPLRGFPDVPPAADARSQGQASHSFPGGHFSRI